MAEEIAGSISGEFPSGFPEEVLERISAAAYVTTFADSRWCHHCVALVSETLCNSSLANQSELRDAYVGHRSPNHCGQSENNSIHGLRKNINSVTMPTHDVLLRHLETHVSIHSCTLLSLMYSW